MGRKSKQGIVVLSVFDGMSCGQLALQRSGVKVKTYYASEINKYAIKVTQSNFPNTVQLGSVTDVHIKDLPEIPDLLIGGSPCQGFSRAGKGLNFDDPRSKLFFEYVRLWNELKELNPDAKFLLENVRMLKEWENIISKFMGVNPVLINSALVSAQNRERLYWNNFNIQKYGLFDHTHNVISQPKDRKIFLKDILQDDVDEKYFLSEKMIKRLLNKTEPSNVNSKAKTFTAGGHSGGLHSDMDLIVHNTQPRSGDPLCVAMHGRNPDNPKSRKSGLAAEQRLEVNETGKTNSLTTVTKDNLIKIGSLYENNSQGGRIYLSNGKATTLNSQSGGLGALYDVPVQLNQNKESGGKQPYQQNRVYDTNGKAPANQAQLSTGSYAVSVHSRIRRLTPVECCRLQTVPDDYFHDSNGVQIISDSRIYECLGNGWTVDVIVHQFEYYKKHLSQKDLISIRKSIKSIARELDYINEL